MKTIVTYEGQKHTIQGECKPREAMEILGLTPKEWKVTSKKITGKIAAYTIERVPSRAVASIPVESPASQIEEPAIDGSRDSDLAMTDLVTGAVVQGAPASTIQTGEINAYREEFQAVLKVVCDVTAKKGFMPILGMVKIEATGGTLTVTATDLEVSYTAMIPAALSGACATSFLVDADILYKEVKALNKAVEDVVITVNAGSIQINGRCSLPVSVPDEFPEIEPVGGTQVSINNLTDVLASVLPAVSTDEARYILTGVCFDLSAGLIIGTDGFRLHRAIVDKAEVAPFVVSRRASALLLKYGAKSLTVGEKRLSADLLGGTFTSRLIEGQYPDTESIWPDVTTYDTVHFRAQEFLDLLPGILPIATSGLIKLKINGRIDIAAGSSDGRYDWHILAESNLRGEKEIAINAKYLADAIKAYGAKEIDMFFPESYGAIVINGQALVMPVRG